MLPKRRKAVQGARGILQLDYTKYIRFTPQTHVRLGAKTCFIHHQTFNDSSANVQLMIRQQIRQRFVNKLGLEIESTSYEVSRSKKNILVASMLAINKHRRNFKSFIL